MSPQIESAVASWPEGIAFDPVPEMMSLVARSSIVAMCGHGMSRAAVDEVHQDLGVLVPGILLRALLPGPLDRLPLPFNRRFARAGVHLRETLAPMIVEARAAGRDRGDLLSILVGSPDQARPEATLDQLVAFFIASIETTAHSLSWALHLLAVHPDAQRRLQVEADLVLAGASVGPEHLPRLNWTRQVVSETLRLYPPGWLVTRLVRRDTRLGGHPLPAGTIVGFSPYALHHRPDLYPDPELFRPERWAEASMPPRHGYIPFGFAARRCIGESFAWAALSMVLATAAARWHVRPAEGHRVRPARTAVLRPHGARLEVIAREPA